MGKIIRVNDLRNSLHKPADLAAVKISSAFYQKYDQLIRSVTLPAILESLKSTGRFYALTWTSETAPVSVHYFWDSDAYKVMEACCYYLITRDDDKIRKDVDDFIGFVKKAQWEDGYINSHYTVHNPEARLTNLRDMHELYCVGHLAEFAVAYHALTGSLNLIDVVRRFVRLLHRTVIPKGGYPGHEELELALLRVYEITKDRLFLDTAGFFVRERGKKDEDGHNYYDRETAKRGLDPRKDLGRGNFEKPRDYSYAQAHLPITEQSEILGHSVRAVYFLTGALHYALLTPDESVDIRQATIRLFENMVSKKMYITGGLGSVARYEGFGPEYWLPDSREAGGCYSETCATVGLIVLCERLLRESLEGRYGDIMERALFNCFFGALGADGSSFYYGNPLATTERNPCPRSRWFDVACCPPNIVKLIGMLPTFMYSTFRDIIAVHLYLTSNFNINLSRGKVTLAVESDMPWDGSIKISVQSDLDVKFRLALRIPDWACDEYTTSIPGYERNGYLFVNIESNSQVELNLPLHPKTMYAHPRLRKDDMAVSRGPLIYCAESPDNEFDIERIYVKGSSLAEIERQTIAGWENVPLLQLEGQLRQDCSDTVGDTIGGLYTTQKPRWEDRIRQVKLIPYFLRNNRAGNGAMRVWLRSFRLEE